jgi:vesicle coat complex subunit
MTAHSLRKQIQQQIEALPEDILREVADFMAFVVARRRYEGEIADWDEETWQQMAIEQFFRESSDVEYTIDDAIEVYEP